MVSFSAYLRSLSYEDGRSAPTGDPTASPWAGQRDERDHALPRPRLQYVIFQNSIPRIQFPANLQTELPAPELTMTTLRIALAQTRQTADREDNRRAIVEAIDAAAAQNSIGAALLTVSNSHTLW